MRFTAFAALVKKDLLLFFRDRRSVIMSFAAPIAIASFFGFVMGGPERGDERARIPVWVIDEDSSGLTNKIAARLRSEESLEIKTGSLAAARADVRAGKAAAAAVFPKDFGRRATMALFTGGEKPPLTLLYDPSRGAEREMVKGIITGHAMQVAGQEIFGGGATTRAIAGQSLAMLGRDKSMPKAQKDALKDLLKSVDKWSATPAAPGGAGGGGPGLSLPYEVKQEAVTAQRDGKYNSFAHSFTGMGVQFILFMGIEAGVMLLTQRQRGLWKRFRAAPVSRSMLLTSRAVSAAISALIIMAVLFTFARVVFGVKIEGSLPGFLLVCFAFSLVTAAFGLLVAAYGKTPEATRPLAIFATLIMVMLGGSWVPTFLFPAWLQTATKIVPTRWAVDGLNGMTWRGLGFDYALTCSGMLLIFAAVFAFIALRQFRWETD